MSLVVRPNSSAAGPVAGGSAKWLWAAIGALGVSVLALGATLVVQNRDRAPDVASAVQPAAALAPDAQSAAAANPSINPAAVQGAQGRPSAVAQAPSQQFAQRAPSPSYAPQPAYSGAPQGQQQVAMQRAAAPACMTCGRVESVQAFQQAAPATGIGAVAGGVIGGVLGNQVGKGSGRTAATVLGAVGGGYLGHTVEQRTRTTTAYQIRVRMDDGSVRTFTRSQPVAEGTAVRVEGRSFRVDNGQYGSGYGGGYSAQAPHSVRVADNGY